MIILLLYSTIYRVIHTTTYFYVKADVLIKLILLQKTVSKFHSTIIEKDVLIIKILWSLDILGGEKGDYINHKLSYIVWIS